MKKNLKIFLIVLIISIILFFIIQFTYKSVRTGNNISKSSNDLIENILEISSYEAELEVTVNSNKTTNKYVLEQYYESESFSKQIVKFPGNLENIEIIYNGNNLEIKNHKFLEYKATTNNGLEKINIDGILDTNYIAENIKGHKFCLFFLFFDSKSVF